MRFLPNIIKNRPRKKWSAERIRERFDADAEQFAALAEGQKEVVDAKVMRDLVAKAAAATTPHAQAALDVGCGGGFYAQGIIAELPGIRLTLTDISREMLDNAAKQLAPRIPHEIVGLHGDIRCIDIGSEAYDVITAAAVLHHLRKDEEWETVFSKLFAALKPKGSLWIADIVAYHSGELQQLMNRRYMEYLGSFHQPRRVKTMMKHIELEDSPRPLSYQLDLLSYCGFTRVEVLHANTSFAAFGAIKQ